MPKKPTKGSDAKTAKRLPAAPTPSPKKDASLVRAIHGRAAPASVYATALKHVFGEGHMDDMTAYARDVIARINPRDPAEEMLAAQMLFAHARVMRLTELANRQTDVEGIRVVNEYADRASNTFRRLMLALAEYRRPPRTGDMFAVVKQANIAGQQVVQNHEKPTEKSTNEQGCDATTQPAGQLPGSSTTLPAFIQRPSVTTSNCQACETVGAVHRPKKH